MLIADKWKEYTLLDTGDGAKLEQWGDVVLSRPDPQVIWPKQKPALWKKADAVYRRSKSGGGDWSFKHSLPEHWLVRYGKLVFQVKPTGFKHTGLFPEQAVNWDWQIDLLRKRKGAKVLNLFAYTGGATVACASAGAQVCHVDSSKGIVRWAANNLRESSLGDAPVRLIVDDALKFVEREKRRGNQYDAIIMDPPSYGRGSNGEAWKIEKDLFNLVKECVALLSNKPLFFLINSYTAGFSPAVLHNLLEMTIISKHKGSISTGEVGLSTAAPAHTVLPCGIFGRWSR